MNGLTIKLTVDDIPRMRFNLMLERLRMGYPLRFKEQKMRSPEKLRALIGFYVRTTPSAEDILSGSAFRKLLNAGS